MILAYVAMDSAGHPTVAIALCHITSSTDYTTHHIVSPTD